MRVKLWTTVERGTGLQNESVQDCWFFDEDTARTMAHDHGHDVVPVELDVVTIGLARAPDDRR